MMTAASHFESLRFAVELLVLGTIFSLESATPLFERDFNGRIAHAFPNLFFGIFNSAVIAYLFSALTLQAIRWSAGHSFGLLYQVNMPIGLKTFFGFLIYDGWMYAWHRANHTMPFFWRFHRMHHSDPALDVTSALRFHTGEIIFSSILRVLVLMALGMSAVQLMVYEICLQPVILFHHSNIRLPEKIDRIVRTVIVTPNMHRVHHSVDISETNSNYASVFSFWDRIFRTFRKREDVRKINFGLPDFKAADWQSIGGMFRTPLAKVS